MSPVSVPVSPIFIFILAWQLAGKPLPPVVEAEVSHEEVLEIGRQRGEDMRKLVEKIVEMAEAAQVERRPQEALQGAVTITEAETN